MDFRDAFKGFTLTWHTWYFEGFYLSLSFLVILDCTLCKLQKEALIPLCVLLTVYIKVERVSVAGVLVETPCIQPRWQPSPPSAAEVSAACLDSRRGDGGRRQDYHANRSET